MSGSVNVIFGEHMRKAMAWVEPVAAKAGKDVRLVRIVATEKLMSVEATDYEMWVRYFYPGAFDPVDMVVPVDKLSQIVKANKAKKNSEFVVSAKDGRMVVSFGRATFTIPSVNGQRWGEPPSAEGSFQGVVDTHQMLRALKRIAPSMGTAKQCTGPPIGAGVFVASKASEGLKLVAPSRHRVGKEEVGGLFEKDQGNKFWGVLPRRACVHLRELEGDATGSSRLCMNFNNFALMGENHEIVGSLVATQGGAPNLRPFIDCQDGAWQARMNRESLVGLLAVGGTFSDIEDTEGKCYSRVTLRFGNGKVALSSGDNGGETSSLEDDCESSGEATITINGDYLKELNQVLEKGEEFELRLGQKRNRLFVSSGTFSHSISLMVNP